jgi:hypothetical protein
MQEQWEREHLEVEPQLRVVLVLSVLLVRRLG